MSPPPFRQHTPNPDATLREPTGTWAVDARLIDWRISQLEQEQAQEMERRDKREEAQSAAMLKQAAALQELNITVSNLKVSYGFLGLISGISGAVAGTCTALFAAMKGH